ncbi:hypothetical protein DPMN_157097 [Dreissena polymorpha]|uniref:MAM domain-containing protein n=1 Tax=Dreissena polymorpha TaxID=45954 RepID=A0A9D4EGH1_DREPO|nr:hypothetical protein DPMN_157097 [Dreissena polymorpha]
MALIGWCTFDDGPCDWSNMAGDDFDWVLYKGSTPTGETDDTGPTADHTFGNATGLYAFIESSSPRAHDDKAWFVSRLLAPTVQSGSQCLNFDSPSLAPTVQSGPQCLHFWYNMHGASIGTLKVFMSQNNAIPGYTIWGLSENQSRDWKQAHVTLYSHVDFRIIVEGTVGAGFLGDIAIDDIVLSAHPCSEDSASHRPPSTSQTSTQVPSTQPMTNKATTIGQTTPYQLGSQTTAMTITQPTTNASSTKTTKPPFQLGTQTTHCHQCTDPIQICEQIHFSKPCLYPNNYCINHITNHLDGTKTVNRTCGNFDTCYREWYLGTSDEDKCDVIKNNQHVDFQCTFCCINDDCNIPLRPAEDSLYKPNMAAMTTTHPTTNAPSTQTTEPPPIHLGIQTTIKTEQPTTIAPATQTTEAPPFQLGTESSKCHQCTGPIQICEQIHFSKLCLYPNNYCINHITNHLDGTRTVNRTCGNFDTCYREWHLGTSDEDKCDVIKNNQHVDFQCTFCCIKNDCNVPLRPAEDSLYKPRMIG